jgi:hypothetical protein
MEFLLRNGIYFVSVDITNDKIKMRSTWGIEIPADRHIDLQDRFKLKHDKTSMDDMAAALIDESYASMKKKFPKSQHNHWAKTPLDPINIDYAAVDGYVSYELYRRIGIYNYAKRHLVPLVPPAYGISDSEDDE